MSEPTDKPKLGLKLKLNTKPQTAPPPPETPTPVSGGAPKMKLKLSMSAAPTPSSENPPALEPPKKEKRKYTKKPKPADGEANAKAPKKRARKGEHDDSSTPAKRPRGSSPMALPSAPGLTLKLKRPTIKPPDSSGPKGLRLKHQGRPPPRPPGVGYDSEAEDAEVDPAIEHQFILRMLPGDDCDRLRRAIDERKIGVKPAEGGFDVHMRFIDKEGRRSIVEIQDRKYAATLLDLPCVIEGMKSWDKKGWWKGGDICQILLVLGPIKNDEEAKTYPLPKEVDAVRWQYPHGLTPPMHYVRKRRFRPRADYRTIEAVEREVERLLAQDAEMEANGGNVDFSVLDPDAMRDEGSAAESEEEDEEGQQEYGDADAEGFEDDMEQDLLNAFDAADEGDDSQLFGGEAPTQHDVAMHAINGGEHQLHHPGVAAATPESAAPSPATGTGSGTGESESEDLFGEDEEDEEEEEEELDEEQLAAQQEAAQQREEIADLEKEVQNALRQMEQQANPLLRQRLAGKVKSLQQDLELKKKSLGNWQDDD